MKSLYSRLAYRWDTLFPPDPLREAFLSERIGESDRNGPVIEVGCGTGATARFLAGLGYHVHASDLDGEMIAVARENEASSGTDGGRLEWTVSDMVAALDSHSGSSACAVLCLGNTLPHLDNPAEIRGFLESAWRATAPGGLLVIQILNYPRIKALGAVDLPKLDAGEFVFHRRQRFNPETGGIVFETELEAGDLRERRSHDLFPIAVDDLDDWAHRAGYGPSEHLGGWDGILFEEDHPWLAAVYRKGLERNEAI